MKNPIERRCLGPADLPFLTRWRNAEVAYLRTPFALSLAQQELFLAELESRTSPHRYVAYKTPGGSFIGVGGLTHIQHENGLAELSLITNPDYAKQGYGRAMVADLFRMAFDEVRLFTVCAECYQHNPAAGFWCRMAAEYGGEEPVVLPRRKYWDGRLHDALYFTWTVEGYRARQRRDQ